MPIFWPLSAVQVDVSQQILSALPTAKKRHRPYIFAGSDQSPQLAEGHCKWEDSQNCSRYCVGQLCTVIYSSTHVWAVSYRQIATVLFTSLMLEAGGKCANNSLQTDSVSSLIFHRLDSAPDARCTLSLFIRHHVVVQPARWLVGWSLTSLFSTNKAISETKGQGWRAIPTQYWKASDILTSTPTAFLFSSHPKTERDREAHLNYYASADNRERQPSHHKTNTNQSNTNTHSS